MFKAITAHLQENAFWPWCFRFTQVVSVAILLFWCWRLPPPGYAIGALAVMAAVMSLHIEAKMQWWEKATWMLLMGAFLILEFKAIKEDRGTQEEVHKKELAQQAKSAEDTIDAILESRNKQMAQNQQQFNQTLDKMNGLTTRAQQTLDLTASTFGEARRAVQPFSASDLVSADIVLNIRPQESVKSYTDRVNPIQESPLKDQPFISEIVFRMIPSVPRARPAQPSDARLGPQDDKDSDRSLIPLLRLTGYRVTFIKNDDKKSAGTLRVRCPSLEWRITNDIALSAGSSLSNSIYIRCKTSSSTDLAWDDVRESFASYLDFQRSSVIVKLLLSDPDELQLKAYPSVVIETNKGHVLSGTNLTSCSTDEPACYRGGIMVSTEAIR